MNEEVIAQNGQKKRQRERRPTTGHPSSAKQTQHNRQRSRKPGNQLQFERGQSRRADAPNEPTPIPRQHATTKAPNEPMGSGQAPADNDPASRRQPPAPNEPNYRQPLSTAESNTRTAPAPNEPTPASRADVIEPAMDRGTGSDERLPEYMRGPVRACYAGNLKDDIKHQ